MKRMLTGVFVVLVTMVTTSHAFIRSPTHEWCAEGPGGVYGVHTFASTRSYIDAGPLRFSVDMSFRAALVLFLGSSLALFLSAVVLLGLLSRYLRGLLKNDQITVWPVGESTLIFLVAAFFASVLLHGDDAYLPLRRNAFLLLSAAYWLRFAIAWYRPEAVRGAAVWMIMILGAPPCLMLIGIFIA